MAEPRNRLINPTLALISLYQKDGKDFKSLLADICARLNSFGLGITDQYLQDKVLPWVFSFLFMNISEQILQEYIEKIGSAGSNIAAAPRVPPIPPAEINRP